MGTKEGVAYCIPSSAIAVSQFRGCILWRMHLKVSYFTTPCKGFPNLKAPPNAPSFHSFWRMHSYYPSRPHIIPKKRERKKTATLRGVDRHFCNRNRNVRVKHLVTQPGNAQKARPSHLTTVGTAFEGLTEGLVFKGRKGRVLQRMQPLSWDTAQVEETCPDYSGSWLIWCNRQDFSWCPVLSISLSMFIHSHRNCMCVFKIYFF